MMTEPTMPDKYINADDVAAVLDNYRRRKTFVDEPLDDGLTALIANATEQPPPDDALCSVIADMESWRDRPTFDKVKDWVARLKEITPPALTEPHCPWPDDPCMGNHCSARTCRLGIKQCSESTDAMVPLSVVDEAIGGMRAAWNANVKLGHQAVNVNRLKEWHDHINKALAPYRPAPDAAKIRKAHDDFVTSLKDGCEPDAAEPVCETCAKLNGKVVEWLNGEHTKWHYIDCPDCAPADAAAEPVCETCNDTKEVHPEWVSGRKASITCPDCAPASGEREEPSACVECGELLPDDHPLTICTGCHIKSAPEQPAEGPVTVPTYAERCDWYVFSFPAKVPATAEGLARTLRGEFDDDIRQWLARDGEGGGK